VKTIPTPGVRLFFDFPRPIDQNDGATAESLWRVAAQIRF